ncbi:MAG: transpeptidase family protein [Paludibacter sp.]|nr:transpeptidase family protein [Bacteroidales bacterium]MCM1068353.1 transpeptidase family protein [Prevotella sp.]MCM1354019.1 transpeptidase family protein [Bacteroides sp.]MCM1442139.1 transpeptidase family protein [Muribaculum sp.]MCM1481968.1 transpeptidase family protein [Paludibacter sp.]
MEENKRHTIIRFAIIFLLLVCGFGVVIAKIVYTQTVERDKYLTFINKTKLKEQTVKPNRGNIYDCRGNLLAGSVTIYELHMDTRTEALRANNGKLFYEYIDSISDALSLYFKDKSSHEYKKMITDAYNKGNRWLLLQKNRVTFSQLQDIKKMPLFRKDKNKSGLTIEEAHQRIKPFGTLASRTIGGIYTKSGQGNSGLELQYEDVLCGKDGRKEVQIEDGRAIVLRQQDAEDGNDIVTTIDINLQDIVETQLLQQLNHLQADWGCCILMEVKTGEVKAIANLGLQNGKYVEDKNYAVTRVEPGSTFKTYSLMAALDDSNLKLNDTLNTENGSWVYCDPKHPIRDDHKYATLTTRQILAASSNIGTAKIITRTYEKKASKFINKLDKMGVRDSIPFEIPGTQAPLIEIPSDKETLARMSFGYSVELSPIAILAFYNAIANNGKMIRPYLVKEIQHNGKTLETFDSEVLQSSICKASTLADIKECLESVVWDKEGTASYAQSDIVRIVGKTGTTRILENGIYDNNRHRITFCGYFPMENPQYTCICMIHNPRTSRRSNLCAQTVRRIAEKTMAYASYIPIAEHYVHPDSMVCPPVKRGMQADIRKATKGTKVAIKTCNAEWARLNENYQSEPLTIRTDIVPNVIGMGAKDAVYAIEQTGMHARLSGKGKVIKQSVPQGSKPQKGGTIYIELR